MKPMDSGGISNGLVLEIFTDPFGLPLQPLHAAQMPGG